MQETWTQVDAYFGDLLAPADPTLEAVLAANRSAGLPPIDVSRLQGKFLDLLVRISGARRILEIGTLGGYSTIWFARALPQGGRVVTLELSPKHADVARANWHSAGVADRIELHVGKAAESLASLVKSGVEPFDLIFIDADKSSIPAYLDWSLRLSHPGTVILTDNVVRDGKVLQTDGVDEDVAGVRRFAEMVSRNPRLSATVLQTVGSKGYDGFALAVVGQ